MKTTLMQLYSKCYFDNLRVAPGFRQIKSEDCSFIQNGTYRKPSVLSGKVSEIVEEKRIVF